MEQGVELSGFALWILLEICPNGIGPKIYFYPSHHLVISLRDGRRAASLITRASLAMLPTGHIVFSSQPDQFLTQAEPFLGQTK